jgi:hydroxymethylpyrimidine/phosphomethylpyrimidine kinase
MKCCENIFLITPNTEEAKALTSEKDAIVAAEKLSTVTSVFLKSYSGKDEKMTDVLFLNDEVHYFETAFSKGLSKHGSGCVLSSAITAFLANGYDLKLSCEFAKQYTLEFLKSSTGLLGEHKKINFVIENA